MITLFLSKFSLMRLFHAHCWILEKLRQVWTTSATTFMDVSSDFRANVVGVTSLLHYIHNPHQCNWLLDEITIENVPWWLVEAYQCNGPDAQYPGGHPCSTYQQHHKSLSWWGSIEHFSNALLFLCPFLPGNEVDGRLLIEWHIHLCHLGLEVSYCP